MTRSVAVAAVAALAVFGSVAIGGTRDDLVEGLEAGFAEHVDTADVWVTTTGRSLTTDGFRITEDELARLRAEPSIASVRIHQGGMLDIGDRRIWIVARSTQDRRMLPATQIVRGDPDLAEQRLRQSGWVAVSRTIADERDLRIGRPFGLSTPGGTLRLRLAAVVTNLGWGSGAMVLNTGDYRRGWGTTDASALEIDLASGVPPAAGVRTVRAALGPGRAFDVQSARELEAEFTGVLREGLTRLSQIMTLMLVATALALAAAMSAAVWQRRRQLASHKIQGFTERQLRRVLLLESVVVLAVGCMLGTFAGVYAHLLGGRWLELTTGYPAPFSLQSDQALTTLLFVSLGAATVVAVVGYLAARVPPRASFQE